jgi:hypothetical protein
MWRGKLSSGASVLWDEMLAADLAERVPELVLGAVAAGIRQDRGHARQLTVSVCAGLNQASSEIRMLEVSLR